ncbi:MAG: L-seryl-tRNA(Sec) selenium transferase [Desulfobacterales bacterium]
MSNRGDTGGTQRKNSERSLMLPGVDHLLEISKQDVFFEDIPRMVLMIGIREVIGHLREAIRTGQDTGERDLSDPVILEQVKIRVAQQMRPHLRPLINASGVVVHTNLGRSLLADEVIENMMRISGHYSNLEFDLEKGERGIRYSCVEPLLCELTGAEAAMAVNNNAGAVLLCLETLARGKEVIVSRGELVEIGGSFRIPDVMAKSGAILKEVGTTNRTHMRDYENAIGPNTGLLLKVHMSNYSIVGFTAAVGLAELAKLAADRGIPLMEDLGSGTFTDFSRYGLPKEPTVQDSVKAGVSLVTFSGDKLLGGPQAGLIAGKKEYIAQIRKNPLTRALRIDKMTLAALEATLRLYRDPEKAVQAIPTLRLITDSPAHIAEKAEQLAEKLRTLQIPDLFAQVTDLRSRPGGGSLPLLELPSKGVRVRINGMSVNALEYRMRKHQPPVIGRIEEDFFIMDMRTVNSGDIAEIVNALREISERKKA